MAFFKEQLVKIRAMVFDVDGVLASAKTILHHSGDLMRTMNTKDGYAIQKAVQEGYVVGIISGAQSESICKRFEAIGVQDIYLNSADKTADLLDLMSRHGLHPEDVLYMGDDLPDLQVIRMVGLGTCPADAVEEIQAASAYISDLAGGEGCVRDIIEQVLRAQKNWG